MASSTHHQLGSWKFLSSVARDAFVKILAKVKQLHKPGEVCRYIGTLRRPVGNQANIIEASLKHLLGIPEMAADMKKSFSGCLKILNKAITLNVDMGGGKTFMLLSIVQGLVEAGFKRNGVYNIAVVTPSHVVPKFAKEIKETIPNAKIVRLEGKSAVKKFNRTFSETKPGVTFFLIGTSQVRTHFSKGVHVMASQRDMSVNLRKAKLDGRKRAESPWARCPHCGQVIHKVVRQGRKTERVPLRVKDVTAHYSHCPEPKFPNAKTEAEKAKRCGFPLVGIVTRVSDVDKHSGEEVSRKHRYSNCVSLSYYLMKKMKGKIDVAVLDELHEGKGKGPQGQSMGWIAQASKLVLGSTGTLLNGYPESIWYLGWRMNPSSMRKAGFKKSGFNRFCEKYGRVRKTSKVSNDGKVRISRSMQPGITPTIRPQILSSWTIRMGLLEVFHPDDMPEYKEKLLKMPLHEKQKKLLEDVRVKMKEEVAKAKEEGFSAYHELLQRYILTTMTHPDNLKQKVIDFNIERLDETGVVEATHRVTVTVPKLKMKETPKERKVYRTVERHLKIGRKSIIACPWTGAYDTAERLRQVGEARGLRVAVLRAKGATPKDFANGETYDNNFELKAEEREAWFQKHGKDYDAVICNPSLIETGIDLFDFPTLFFYQPFFNTTCIRQSSKRSYRYGQERAVRVYFVFYEDSYQEEALARVATRLDATLLAEGNGADSDLFDMSCNRDGAILREMAKALDETDFGMELAKMKEPPRLLEGERLASTNISELLTNGMQATTERMKPVMAPAPDAAEEETPKAKTPAKAKNLPKTAKPVPAMEKAEEETELPKRLVYSTVRLKEGRKTKVVTEEVAFEDVPVGSQLSIFG